MKKLAIGTMMASAVFSFSALLDEFLAMPFLKYKSAFRTFFELGPVWNCMSVPSGTRQ